MQHTARLFFDELRTEHADELFVELQDERIYTFIPEKPYGSPAELQARYGRMLAGPKPESRQRWLNWVMVDVALNRPVGTLQATVMLKDKVAYVAYVVFPRYWKRGYATEGLSWLLDLLKATDGGDVAKASIDARNAASIRVVARLGFAFEKAVEVDGIVDHVFTKPLRGSV